MSVAIQSVLIANRGEIACRIIRSCRRLGLRSIAVYSDADRTARHVREADDAVHIGPSEAAASYLDVERIVAAALSAGADAVHPGYGFLSERTALPQACTANGLIWVGPNADVIERMGSKIGSKHIAHQAGVASVPGYHGDEQTPERLIEEACRIGFPVLIKASAGGGGKGMRRVDSRADFAAALDLARREARRAFGDDRVLIEKLITRPRHLEVQLAGDHHGNLVHLFERECSIQRNYQKLIEEAPAAHLPEPTRQRLYEAALKLGHAIRYDSLGTVEFVLDEDSGEPYFLEMNTRLQVEHTVTEQITGLDLVELQLRVAGGEPLPFDQAALRHRGWAIEARINCEDPARDHRPQFGRIEHYCEPTAEGLRVDSGVGLGSEVGPHYDSMVAKLIGFGASRELALRRLLAGLASFEAVGVGTNQHFLSRVLSLPAFRTHPLTTRFLAEAFPGGYAADDELRRLALAAAAFAALDVGAGDPDASPWHRRDAWRNMKGAGRAAWAGFQIQPEGEAAVTVRLRPDAGQWRAEVDGNELLIPGLELVGDAALRLRTQAGATLLFRLAPGPAAGVAVYHHGLRWNLRLRRQLDAAADVSGDSSGGSGEIRAAIPGLVTEIAVRPGQAVERGELVVVMEAMKLIFQLQAPASGVVAEVCCRVGETVAADQPLIRLEPPAARAEDTPASFANQT